MPHVPDLPIAPEIDAAFASFSEQQIGMLSVSADPYFLSRRDQFATLAVRLRGHGSFWHKADIRLSPSDVRF